MTDGPNGARGDVFEDGAKAACFPCTTLMAATFDKELLYAVGIEIAKDAKSKSADVLLAPTCNIIRSPLGGRSFESFSEDPHLSGILGSSFINGVQSQGVAATPKHFTCNEVEKDRRIVDSIVSERALREIYLYPFQLIVLYSNPFCLMTAYNKVNGTSCSENSYLLKDILRKEWGFKGLVMSDWFGTYSTIPSIKNGLDLEMPGPPLWRGKLLLEAYTNGAVPLQTIDDSVRRVLELQKNIGILGRTTPEHPERTEITEEKSAFIRKVAANGIVLLKNDNNVLPIPKTASVAVIGYAGINAVVGGGGSASLNAQYKISPLEACKMVFDKVEFSPGLPIYNHLPLLDSSFIKGEITCEWSNGSEPGKNVVLKERLPKPRILKFGDMPEKVNCKDYNISMKFVLVPETNGNHTMSLVASGRCICKIDGKIVFDTGQSPKISMHDILFNKTKVEMKFSEHMDAGKYYQVEVISWATKADNFGGHGLTFGYLEEIDIKKSIQEAAEVAMTVDYALVFTATTEAHESEGFDRIFLELPNNQDSLIKQVSKANKNTIVINHTGSAVSMGWKDSVPGIIQAFFTGQECGNSVVDVLTGKINPSGRLPFTIPINIETTPAFKNFPGDENKIIRYKEGNRIGYRHYLDGIDCTYPFGYGLSYTTFGWMSPSVIGSLSDKDDSAIAQITVKNTGTTPGAEVIQLYIEAPDATLDGRPLRELKGFEKVFLRPGESKQLYLTINKYSVSYYEEIKSHWVAKKGEYIAAFGKSSFDIVARATFSVNKTLVWNGL